MLCARKQESLCVDEDMNCGHKMVEPVVFLCEIGNDVLFSVHWDSLFIRVIEMEVTQGTDCFHVYLTLFCFGLVCLVISDSCIMAAHSTA